jgi:hypothetical protein
LALIVSGNEESGGPSVSTLEFLGSNAGCPNPEAAGRLDGKEDFDEARPERFDGPLAPSGMFAAAMLTAAATAAEDACEELLFLRPIRLVGLMEPTDKECE